MKNLFFVLGLILCSGGNYARAHGAVAFPELANLNGDFISLNSDCWRSKAHVEADPISGFIALTAMDSKDACSPNATLSKITNLYRCVRYIDQRLNCKLEIAGSVGSDSDERPQKTFADIIIFPDGNFTVVYRYPKNGYLEQTQMKYVRERTIEERCN